MLGKSSLKLTKMEEDGGGDGSAKGLRKKKMKTFYSFYYFVPYVIVCLIVVGCNF